MQKPVSVQTDTDRWFVQIKEQVIGPLPGAKVLERLLKDELDVTHRVSRDRQQWAAICNTPFFEELIMYSIRIYSGESVNVGQMHPGGDDFQFEISQVFGLHGATDGISEQLNHARQLEELTANIQKLNFLRKEIQLKKKTVTFEAEKEVKTVHPDDEDVFIPVVKKKKPFDFKSLFKGGSRDFQKPFIWLAGIVVVGAIGTQLVTTYVEQQKEIENRKNIQQALKSQAAGNYAKAIIEFRAVNGIQDPGQNLVTAKELIKLAEAHVQGQQPEMAQKLLVQAIQMSPDEFVAFHNLAILNLKAKKLKEAEENLLKALALTEKLSSVDNSVTLLALFETAVQLDQADKKAMPDPTLAPMKRLHDVIKKLNVAIPISKHHKDELQMALAISHFFAGQSDAFRLAAFELIDSVQFESFMAKPLTAKVDIDDDLATPLHLHRYCTAVYNQPGSTDFVAAFYAACLRRSHGAQVALPFAKYALSVHPTDVAYMGLTADLLFELNQLEEARTLLTNDGSPITGSKLALRTYQRLETRMPASPIMPTSTIPTAAPGAGTTSTTAPISGTTPSTAPGMAAPATPAVPR